MRQGLGQHASTYCCVWYTVVVEGGSCFTTVISEVLFFLVFLYLINRLEALVLPQSSFSCSFELHHLLFIPQDGANIQPVASNSAVCCTVTLTV